MAAREEKTARLLRLAKDGPLRARELAAAGIPRAYLTRLCERGELEHVGRGMYRLANAPATELHAVAQIAKRVPHATICLLTALQIHGLTTEVPHAVWIMIDTRARRPKIDTPAIEIVEAHGPAREHGVETRQIEGVPVSITTPAKTVADCFRYRRHVGLEVAIAALRDYLRQRTRAGNGKRESRIDALVAAARADRVYRVMRPYLEALA